MVDEASSSLARPLAFPALVLSLAALLLTHPAPLAGAQDSERAVCLEVWGESESKEFKRCVAERDSDDPCVRAKYLQKEVKKKTALYKFTDEGQKAREDAAAQVERHC